MEPVSWLCKKADKMPSEVRRLIWHYAPPQHPLATLVKGLKFTVEDYTIEPTMTIECPPDGHWLVHKRLDRNPWRIRTDSRWIVRLDNWRWHDVEHTFPDWLWDELEAAGAAAAC